MMVKMVVSRICDYNQLRGITRRVVITNSIVTRTISSFPCHRIRGLATLSSSTKERTVETVFWKCGKANHSWHVDCQLAVQRAFILTYILSFGAISTTALCSSVATVSGARSNLNRRRISSKPSLISSRAKRIPMH